MKDDRGGESRERAKKRKIEMTNKDLWVENKK